MEVSPKFDEINLKNAQYTHIPLVASFISDTETPISIYKKLSDLKPYSFLLESADNATSFGRYSFIGLNPKKIFEFKDNICVVKKGADLSFIDFNDPLRILESEINNFKIDKEINEKLNLPIFTGGLVGFFSYEASRFFEKMPQAKIDILNIPDGVFALYDLIVVFDHFKHKIFFVKYIQVNSENFETDYQKTVSLFQILYDSITKTELNLNPLEFTQEIPLEKNFKSNFTKEKFCTKVNEILEKVKAGETFQLQISQRLNLDLKEKDSPFDIYRRLRLLNPSPYMYFLRYPNFDIIGASPETSLRVENDEILVRPIAGTRKRTGNLERDLELEAELKNSIKEQAEHMMLVDLARNDVGRVAEIKSVETSNLMHFERFSHVVHLVSDIRGKLRKNKTIFDAFRATFPHGTVTGAPKIRSQQIIAEIEDEKRGIYSGAVGYFDFAGNTDTAIAIRTIVVKGNKAYIQAAGGIVYDSIPEQESKTL